MTERLREYEMAPGYFDVSSMATLPDEQYTQLTVTSFEQARFTDRVDDLGTVLRTDGGYLNKIERPFRSDIGRILLDDFEIKDGNQNLGNAYNWISLEYSTRTNDPEQLEPVDLSFANGFLIGIKGLEDALAEVESADVGKRLLNVRERLGTRIRTARRLETLRIGAYVASRRGQLWTAVLGMTYNHEGYPETGKVAPLLGFGIEKLEERRSGVEIRRNTLVVLGTDDRPYRLADEPGQKHLYSIVDTRYYEYGHATYSDKRLGRALEARQEQKFVQERW